MDKIKAVVFDLDGTIYVGNQLVEGASEILKYLRSIGLNIAFVTNNSSKTIDEIYLKLASLGVSVEKNEIYSSASVTAQFLKKNNIDDLFVIGSSGLITELENKKLTINMSETAKHVVVGMDSNLTKEKFQLVNNILYNTEAKLIVCNNDLDFPIENGKRKPGCGVIVDKVEKAANRKADYVIGKPNKYMMDVLLDDLKLEPEELLIIGDNYDSDIKFALNTGALSVLLTDKFQPLQDTIIIESLNQIKTLFNLPLGVKKLFNLTTFENLKNEILNPYKSILENLSNVYIFGAQRLGEKIFKQCIENNIDIRGFIDNDKRKQNGDFCNKKIVSLSEVDKDNIIIIASTTYLNDIFLQLENNDYKKIIPYPILSLYNPVIFKPEFTFKDMQEDLVENKLMYISLFLKLEDSKSRDTIEKIILFRLTLDTTILDFNEENHYFEDDIYQLGEDEVFIDGGGYIGDTSLEFINKVNKKYKKIYIYEPDQHLLTIAKNNLSNYKNIEYIAKGIYSRDALLGFNLTGELDGNIDTSSENLIQVTSLDSTIDEKITFIKLDVEGAEDEALNGARNHIQKEGPKLAIACYHKCEDLWYLPSVISNINKNYKFYFRHYSQTSLETVLYCIENTFLQGEK